VRGHGRVWAARRRLHGEEVLLSGVIGGHWPVADADPRAEHPADVEAGRQHCVRADAVDGADEVAVDLALAQARRVAPDVLERQTGELAAEATGDEGPEDAGHEAVAAVLGPAEALVGGAPRAVPAADALGLGDHVVPHHLQVLVELVDVPVLHTEAWCLVHGAH